MAARVLVPMLAVLALSGPGFDGCSGGSSGGAVPPGTTAACFADGDCRAAGCEQVACVGSQCMTLAPLRDADRDGFAPPPCGLDCDDTDASVYPGAPEICNGRDDDCDGIIDEDAPPSARSTLLGTMSSPMAAASLGSSIIVTDTGVTPGVRVRAVDLAGRIGGAITVVSAAIEAVDVATTMAGGVVVVGRALGSGHVLEAYPVHLMGGRLVVDAASTIAILANGAQAARVRAAPVGSSFVVVWDDVAQARFAMMPSWSAPSSIGVGIAMTAPFDVASDGTSIAIPSGAMTVVFLAPADGTVAHRQAFATPLAVDPLTGTARDYIVAFHDATDHQLAHMTETAVSPMQAAPRQGSGLPLRIDATSIGTLVTRFDATNARGAGVGVWALLLPDTLDAVRADFAPRMVSSGVTGNATDFAVVASTAGIAVLTNFGQRGSVLTVLGCQPR